jgi:tetratricopeptide (TPR) repeat protein
MLKPLSMPIILALLAALAALLFAWFVPLPRLVLSEEEKAAERMPQDRAAVDSARADFEKAQSAYKAFVASHDVSATLASLEQAAQSLNSNQTDPAQIAGHKAAIADASTLVLDYLVQLQSYAQAGEAYFAALQHYDDELMAWTRSLATESEALRPDTWPIVEYLKRYPPPTGEAADYPSITAADVQSYTESLEFFAPLPDPGSKRISPDVPITIIVALVREAGRSIEYRESLHAGYEQLLTEYDKKVQSVASNSGQASLSSGRATFATGINVLLGAVTLAGLAALFLPRRSGKSEVPQ